MSVVYIYIEKGTGLRSLNKKIKIPSVRGGGNPEATTHGQPPRRQCRAIIRFSSYSLTSPSSCDHRLHENRTKRSHETAKNIILSTFGGGG